MAPASTSTRLDPWQRAAAFFWGVLIIASLGRVLLLGGPRHSSNYPITFAPAGRAWLAGESLYPPEYHGLAFPYSPLYGALFVPFALLPDPLGNALWRAFLAGTFLPALYFWTRAVLGGGTRHLARVAVLILPCVATCLLVGQPNLLVLALLLGAAALAARSRWWGSALLASLAGFMKVYPLAFALLVAVLHPRRYLLPLVVAVGLCALLPFCFQTPDYVLTQYEGWVQVLRGVQDHPWYRSEHNRDIRMLLHFWGAALDVNTYRVLELVVAACFAWLCLWAGRRQVSTVDGLCLALALAGVWMTVFGPAAETYGYAFLGPPLAWTLLREGRRPGNPALCLAWGGLVLFTLVAVSAWFPWGSAFRALGIQPLAGLLFLAATLLDLPPAAGPHLLARVDPRRAAA